MLFRPCFPSDYHNPTPSILSCDNRHKLLHSFPHTFTLTTFTIQSLLAHPSDLNELFTTLSPHILFLQETHLFTTHERSAAKVTSVNLPLAITMATFLSSTPNPSHLHTHLP